jgi:hypothetical protein
MSQINEETERLFSFLHVQVLEELHFSFDANEPRIKNKIKNTDGS